MIYMSGRCQPDVLCPTESSSHSRYHHSHSSQGPGALIPSIWGTLLSGKIRSLPLDKLTRQKFVLNSSTCALSPLDFEINPRKRLIRFNPVFLYFYVNRRTVIFSVQYINKTGGNVQTTGDCDNQLRGITKSVVKSQAFQAHVLC